MSTVFVGQFYTISTGFTQAALNYLMALKTAKHDYQLMPYKWGVQWNEYPEWSHPISQDIPDGLDRHVGILHDFPERFVNFPHPGEKANLGLTTFESDYLPKRILDQLQFSVDGVIVPSTFNKKVLEDSGITIPVHVVPHTLGEHWWNTPVDVSEHDDKYIFGYVGHFTERKNPHAAIRAYLRAFPEPSDDRAFLIKTVTSKEATDSVESQIAEIIKEETGLSSRDDIWVYDSLMSEDDIRWVYSMIDCYVSTHRAEGFGLGPFQAKLLGKPAIYTDYSGVQDFLSSDDGDHPIEYSMVDAPKSTSINGKIWTCPSMTRPIQWADPSIDHAASLMAQCFKKETLGLRGSRLDAFRQKFGWESVGRNLSEVVKTYI